MNVHLKGTAGPSRWAAAYWREQSKAGKPVDARIVNTSRASGIYGNPQPVELRHGKGRACGVHDHHVP